MRAFVGDMQLIGEAYHLLKNVLGLSNPELHDVFNEWNKGTKASCPRHFVHTSFGFQVIWTAT
jgi:6-phosphogluconate dehydrogenase